MLIEVNISQVKAIELSKSRSLSLSNDRKSTDANCDFVTTLPSVKKTLKR